MGEINENYDFGIAKGLKYKETKVLKLVDFFDFIGKYDVKAVVEIKSELTQRDTYKIGEEFIKYDLEDKIFFAEDSRQIDSVFWV